MRQWQSAYKTIKNSHQNLHQPISSLSNAPINKPTLQKKFKFSAVTRTNKWTLEEYDFQLLLEIFFSSSSSLSRAASSSHGFSALAKNLKLSIELELNRKKYEKKPNSNSKVSKQVFAFFLSFFREFSSLSLLASFFGNRRENFHFVKEKNPSDLIWIIQFLW